MIQTTDSILVTGATGKVGSEAVRLLVEGGSAVRAFVRSADSVVPHGAEIAVGDLDDVRSIDAALVGISVVVLVTPGVPTQEIALIEAAVRAGVRHIVYVTSKASLDAPIERRRWHAQVENVLRGSGIAYTLLRSNAYMQNTLGLGPVIAATGAFASSAGEGRMGMVDTRDVAAVGAAIAAAPEQHRGQTYHLTGPEALSYSDVAAVLTDLLGTSVSFSAISADRERELMIARGVPDAVATMNAQAFHLNASGDADWVTADVELVTGRPARSFREFAADHLRAFRA
nr:NmrA family NAD(P)-binding protein [Rhodococcus sp. (in: high G+C Gram-positive bacteria)]